MKINVVGNIMGTSGFAFHTHNLAKCLAKAGHDVAIESPLSQGWEAFVDSETREMLDKNYRDEVNICIGHPQYTQYVMSDRPKGIIQFLVFEGNRLPAFWIPILNDDRINQVWVASEDTKTAALDSGVNADKIFIVSHGVDCSVFKPVGVERLDSRFCFTYVKGWAKGEDDRSGMSDLLIAFAQEFGKDEPVRLSLKINAAYNYPGWSMVDEINRIINKYDIKFENNLVVTSESMDEKKLCEFYNSADCFVAPTRGEAFGLTIAEALACGLPVICTDKGGHVDFASGEFVDYVKSELRPSPELPVYEGINWNYCDLVDLRKKMREAYEKYKNSRFDKDTHKKLVKDKIAEKIISRFEWSNTAEKANKALEALGVDKV